MDMLLAQIIDVVKPLNPDAVHLNWTAIIMRWLHITSACLAIGVPLFVRFVMLPAARGTMEVETIDKFRAAVNRRWSKFVYLMIALFLISGIYTFFVVARWNGPEFTPAARKLYHMLFGIKTLMALGVFFLASALAGRAALFASIRARSSLYLALLIVLGLGVVAISGIMRYLP